MPSIYLSVLRDLILRVVFVFVAFNDLGVVFFESIVEFLFSITTFPFKSSTAVGFDDFDGVDDFDGFDDFDDFDGVVSFTSPLLSL